MGNPRQRRKARSGSHRPISLARNLKKKLKKMPPIHAPKALQDAWDPTLTVRQNYAKLGLILSLNPSLHGGVEPLEAHSHEGLVANDLANDPPVDQSSAPSLEPEYGRIIRDQDGNVLSFETMQPSGSQQVPETSVLEQNLDDNVRQKWAVDLASSSVSQIDAQGEQVILGLEQISVSATGSCTLSLPNSGVGSRHVSELERRYLEPLLKKYGKDVELMAKDRRLNPEQRTIGQLKRALKKMGIEGLA